MPEESRTRRLAILSMPTTTGTNTDRDKIIELGVCLFEYDLSPAW